MIGAHPAGLALAGIAFAVAAAFCRTGVLVFTRAFLVGADARLTTWYSVIAQLAIFAAAALFTQTLAPPQTDGGWVALIALSVATTVAILFIFVSTVRIGPFRTALLTNFEPMIAMVLSAIALGERHHAASGCRQRDHAGGTDRLSVMEMTKSLRSIRVRVARIMSIVRRVATRHGCQLSQAIGHKLGQVPARCFTIR